MPALFLLLFKINLVLLIFAAAYYLVLRKLTFYSLNRAFLIFGILFSSAYPFIDLSNISGQYSKIASIVPQLNHAVPAYTKQDNLSFYWQGTILVFWGVAFFMACRLAIQFYSLYTLHKNSIPGESANHKIRILSDELGPFSFWQTIYVNPALHSKKDLENILNHEKVHIEEWHTVDIILAEVALIFYWFNPGIWLMKRAVRENIEFITDARILKDGTDKKAYQYSLLHAGSLVPAMQIVNNFSLSDLKKRIKMMNAKRSSPLAVSRYLFLLPVLLLTTLAFTISKKAEIKKMIFSKPAQISSSPDIRKGQPMLISKKKRPEIKPERSVTPLTQDDTLKRFLIIEAFDSDSSNIQPALDELPMPMSGDRIKMITVRRAGTEERESDLIFSDPDSVRIRPKNVFIIHREIGENPPPASMDIRHIAVRSQSPQLNGNLMAKFFLNGKEITPEEFRKLELSGPEGAAGDKRLMIRVEKEKKE